MKRDEDRIIYSSSRSVWKERTFSRATTKIMQPISKNSMKMVGFIPEILENLPKMVVWNISIEFKTSFLLTKTIHSNGSDRTRSKMSTFKVILLDSVLFSSILIGYSFENYWDIFWSFFFCFYYWWFRTIWLLSSYRILMESIVGAMRIICCWALLKLVKIRWKKKSLISEIHWINRCKFLSKAFRSTLTDDLKSIAIRERLKPFEQVDDVFLYPDSFTQEADLLTPTMKLKRFELHNYFRHEIDNIIMHMFNKTSKIVEPNVFERF